MKPYLDEKLSEHCWIRTFDPTVSDNEEYVWHRDHNDREVEVLEGSDWKFQFDNELPFVINIGDKLTIPKMVYHRLIPGQTKLRIKINEEF
jgi:hypothetical protein